MKPIVKHIISAVCFVLILAALLYGSSQLFIFKNSRINTDAGAKGIYSESENTIDALFLGDSETYSSIAPLHIWNDCGITSYVCATSAQKLVYTNDLLESVFRCQSPKVVFLETNAIFRDFDYTAVFETKANRIFPIFKYHDSWKKIGRKKSAKSYSKYERMEKNKGFFFSNTIEAVDKTEHPNKSAVIPSKNEGYIKNIIDVCERNGAKFVFLSTPTFINWNTKRHDTIQGLADKYGVDYVDMNLLCDEVPIDWKTDSRDKGDHLNYRGALKVSSYLGTYLQSTGIFEDRREDEDYSEWFDSYKDFIAYIEEELKES